MKNEEQLIHKLLMELLPLSAAEQQLDRQWQKDGHSLIKILKALKKRREWFNLNADDSFDYWAKEDDDDN